MSINKKIIYIFFAVIISIICFSITNTSAAAYKIGDGVLGPIAVGDFSVSAIYDSLPSGGVNPVLDVPTDKSKDATFSTASKSLSIKELKDYFTSAGISSTTQLGFLFSLNEVGKDLHVRIDSLEIGFINYNKYNSSDTLTYDFNGDMLDVNAKEKSNGNSTSEAFFTFSLPYDFMTFSGDGDFSITATISSNSAGPDYFWLSSEYSRDPSPVPVPGAMWLLGAGLFSLAGIRRRIFKA